MIDLIVSAAVLAGGAIVSELVRKPLTRYFRRQPENLEIKLNDGTRYRLTASDEDDLRSQVEKILTDTSSQVR